MHLADGILTHLPAAASANLLGAAGVAAALVKCRSHAQRSVAWTGTLAAFVLAAQALNVPLVPGASAHIVGAALLTLVVGPARAIVALFAVLVVQALLLGDGGISVLGVNALNLAVLPALATHTCRRLFGGTRAGLMAAAVAGTLLGSLAGAASLATTLVVGAGAPIGETFGWLVGVQGLAGLVEGILTALAVRALLGRAPGLLAAPAHRRALDEQAPAPVPLRWGVLAIGLTVALLPLASATPDALEVVVSHLSPNR